MLDANVASALAEGRPSCVGERQWLAFRLRQCLRFTFQQIGERVGVTRERARQLEASGGARYRYHTLPSHRCVPASAEHFSYKLTNADRRRIVDRYAAGERPIDLAHEFGVTSGHVINVAKRRVGEID